jgi:hypothetical protein
MLKDLKYRNLLTQQLDVWHKSEQFPTAVGIVLVGVLLVGGDFFLSIYIRNKKYIIYLFFISCLIS